MFSESAGVTLTVTLTSFHHPARQIREHKKIYKNLKKKKGQEINVAKA